MILDNAKNFYEERKKIVEDFNDGKFSLKSDDEMMNLKIKLDTNMSETNIISSIIRSL